MKRRTTLLIFGMVLSVLLVQLLAGPQPSHAYYDCESALWDAFMNANDTYTSTFRSWYLGQPETCLHHCQTQCSGLSGTAYSACIDSCLTNCNNERYDAFSDAQDALMSAVSQPCQFNPDACDQARYNRDQCVATYNLEWQYPVLDANNNVDETWSNMVSTEFSSCMAASGIMACE